VNWPTLGSAAATSAVSLGGNRARQPSNGYRDKADRVLARHRSSMRGKRQRQRPEHGSDFREMAMNKKFMFVALGYLLLLAALGFALDASIVAMIVHS
jgi:hypothetical protein